jgi:long-subunit acyl-CoA synthetase (AMP-forming)
MTETTPNVCTMKRDEARARAGWVGRLVPTYQARLVRPEDGLDADADAGESGELWVRSPSVMKGYHANPTATESTMSPGGWLRTGDILIRDTQGWFKVVDRLKELIKYKGYQGEF